MFTDGSNEPILSDPWLIQFLQDDSQGLHDLVNNVTEQAASLALNEQNVSAEPKNSYSWPEHERLTGEILNKAANRVAAETFKNICVYHPTQNHRPSQDGSTIRPDFIIAWSYNGVRKNTAVVDAKDYHGQVPRTEYDKIRRDMGETKATRGILVLGENATISDKLRADIEKDNKVDIVQMQKDQTNVIRDVSQHIGRIIDKNFAPDDKRWEAYKSHVTSTEYPKERRPNPYGENDRYTCNSTYHQFNYPRKQDGTVDERYEANRDRNKDGVPDMRMVHNKSKQAQIQHLNEDRSEDMRSKEHREELVDETGHRLNVDESLDMRCKENKVDTPTNTSSDSNNGQTIEISDMRKKENRPDMVDDEGHHLNVDGSSDMRFKENQEVNASSSGKPHLNTNQIAQEEINETDTTIPTKNNGTADMRYTVSKDAVASGIIEPDEKLTEESGTIPTGDNEGFGEGSTLTDIPTKSDGTADMRYNASQDAVASGDISRDQVLSGGSDYSISETVESSPGKQKLAHSLICLLHLYFLPPAIMDNTESSGGPLKADGTPDMRFSANQ
ncbi:unnamed protein product [Rotaria sp. Silwood2]|nr:unnamed protein product [Rotaria sp. Silwood2]CAF4529187.1 unnamed protein product [Rotaria sp. Silwood2]